MNPLLLLGALLCAVCNSAEVLPQKDFNLQGMAGKWYRIGFATNSDWYTSRYYEMNMGMANMVPTAGGDLELSYANRKPDGSCWRMTHLAKKTDTPGRFTFSNERWGYENDMRVVDVKYDQYALVHTIKTKAGVSEVLNNIYSRSTELSPELVKMFEQFSMDTGILPKNIAILPNNGECPSE